MTGTDQRDDKLGDAIEEAQRKAVSDQQWAAHRDAHEATAKSHDDADDLRWAGHRELHAAHTKAHDQEHTMTAAALDKAVDAMDRRLEGMNEFRSSLRDAQATFATSDKLDSAIAALDQRFDALATSISQRFVDVAKHTDDRYEDNRKRIETIEKGDIKGEGKSLGQGAVIAAIVVGLTVTGTIISLIVVIANLLSGKGA